MSKVSVAILLTVAVLTLRPTDGVEEVETFPFNFALKIHPCLPDILDNRTILSPPRASRSRVDCARRCTRDKACGLAVHQIYADGSATCTKLSRVQGSQSQDSVDVTSSEKCFTVVVQSRCQNGGFSENGICVCSTNFTEWFLKCPESKDVISSEKCLTVVVQSRCQNGGFYENGICVCSKNSIGEFCQFVRPAHTSTQWIKIADVRRTGTSIMDQASVNEMMFREAKVRFRDNTLGPGVSVVMRGAYDMDCQVGIEMTTFPSLQKSSWNKLAEWTVRRIWRFWQEGSELLMVNSTVNDFTVTSQQIEYEFLAMDMTYHSVIVPENTSSWSLMKANIERGHEAFGINVITMYSDPLLVMQLTSQRTALMRGSIYQPPCYADYKGVLGVRGELLSSLMGQGKFYYLSKRLPHKEIKFNPRWMSIENEFLSQRESTEKLRAYLERGHDVRVYAENTYYEVRDVSQLEKIYAFMVAHTTNNPSPNYSSPNTLGVKRLVTSSGEIIECHHVMEGEGVNKTVYKDGVNVRWFVDTRMWRKVYAVFSNSSIAYGTLSDLASHVKEGFDVRVWIKWLNVDKSRFLDTHTSSVTLDYQVSTESYLTWALQSPMTSVELLSPKCDYEYTLVTSDGYVEVVRFNIWTSGTPEVQNDVMVTWFVV